jgi:hypothetical protein
VPLFLVCISSTFVFCFLMHCGSRDCVQAAKATSDFGVDVVRIVNKASDAPTASAGGRCPTSPQPISACAGCFLVISLHFRSWQSCMRKSSKPKACARQERAPIRTIAEDN